MIIVDAITIRAVMFNRAFAKKHLKPGKTVTLSGKWDANRLQITVNKYKIGRLKGNVEISSFYTLKGKLTNYRFQSLVRQAYDKYKHALDEILPDHYLYEYKLPKRHQAVEAMHFPTNRLELKHARRRFIYEELLMFQLQMQLLRKLNRETNEGVQQNFDDKKIETFKQSLPFKLTKDQERSLNEILADLQSPYRMHRL